MGRISYSALTRMRAAGPGRFLKRAGFRTGDPWSVASREADAVGDRLVGRGSQTIKTQNQRREMILVPCAALGP